MVEFAISEQDIKHTREGGGRTADPHVSEVREQMVAGIAVSEQAVNGSGKGRTVEFVLPKSKTLTEPREYKRTLKDGTVEVRQTAGGQDGELMLHVRLLREAADAIGRGLSLDVQDGGRKGWLVRFQTKTRKQTTSK